MVNFKKGPRHLKKTTQRVFKNKEKNSRIDNVLILKDCLQNTQFDKYPTFSCITQVLQQEHWQKHSPTKTRVFKQLASSSALMCNSTKLVVQHADSSLHSSSEQEHREVTTAKQTLSKVVFKQLFQP